MMKLAVASLLLLSVACTKVNPGVCCVSAEDCAKTGLPTDSTCDPGQVCRGNQCIIQACDVSANCDATASYCVSEAGGGRCEEHCTDDNQCPGFGQTLAQMFCAGGTCAECRTNDDCSAATPICGAGTCTACTTHDQCSSGVCAADGTCVGDSAIAYVDLAGTANSECTASSPCTTIKRALELLPERKYLLIASGTYSTAAAISPSDERWLIGHGTTQPAIRRSTPGPIFDLKGGLATGISTDTTIEGLDIGNATDTDANAYDGAGIRCQTDTTPLALHVRTATFHNNSAEGVRSSHCSVDIARTTFSHNRDGVGLGDSTGTIDRSVFIENVFSGVNLDGGEYTVTNCIVARNGGRGIDFYSTSSSNHIEFNTVVNNGLAAQITDSGFACNSAVPLAFPNNIIAGNLPNQGGGGMCTFPGSIIADSIDALKFKSPIAMPYDFHLTTGSSAIDAAIQSTMDHDFDGDARPQGAGRDVGADEFKP